MKSALDQLLYKNDFWQSHAFVVFSDQSGFDNLSNHLIKRFGSTNEVRIFGTDQELFSVDQVREVRDYLLLKSLTERIIVIRAIKLPPISQNALLKLVEEGSNQTTLIISTSVSTSLLPTLRSRVQVISLDSTELNPLIQQFLQADLPTRLLLWDQVTEANILGDILVTIINRLHQNYSVKDHEQLQTMITIYRSWQAGVLAPKYTYESISMLYNPQ